MTIRDSVTPLNLVLALGMAVTTIAGFVLIPGGTNLPVHWGVTGEADGFLPRDAALLLLPAVALPTVILLVVIAQLAERQRAGAARYAIGAMIPALLGLFLAIEVATIMIGIGIAVDMVRLVVLCVGVLFAVLGNVLPKTQPNGVAGIRLPWTMRDPANWQATNRFGGLLLMLGGLAMIVAALLTGNSIALLIVTATGVVLPVLVTTIYSYRLAYRS